MNAQTAARWTRAAAVLGFVAICLIWGTTWLAIKVGLHATPPLTATGLRFLLAGALLYGLAACLGQAGSFRALPWKAIVTLATWMFGLDYALTYLAETRLDSSLVAVLFAMLPFFAFGFAHVMLGERTTLRTWIAAIVALGGVALVSLTGAVRGSPLFALAAIGSAASAAYADVYAKRYVTGMPLRVLPPAMILAGVTVLAIGVSTENVNWAQVASPPSLASLCYLAILGSDVAFLLMVWLLKHLRVGFVSLSSTIFPVVAMGAGVLVGGERVSSAQLIGSAFVLGGLGIALAPRPRFGRPLASERSATT